MEYVILFSTDINLYLLTIFQSGDNDSGSRYGSGTLSGGGYGNKSSHGPDSGSDHLGAEYGSDNRGSSGGYGDSSSSSGGYNDRSSDAYSGGTEYGSGATGGAGSGNKTGSFSRDNDENSSGGGKQYDFLPSPGSRLTYSFR